MLSFVALNYKGLRLSKAGPQSHHQNRRFGIVLNPKPQLTRNKVQIDLDIQSALSLIFLKCGLAKSRRFFIAIDRDIGNFRRIENGLKRVFTNLGNFVAPVISGRLNLNS